MIRTLKALCLALAAIFTLSAVAASAATAQQGALTSDGPVTLTGTQTGEGAPVTLVGTQTGAAGSNALTAFGGKTECANAVYTGHEVNSTTNPIPSGGSAATVTPHYGSCVSLGLPATVDMNGCDYVFDLEGTTGKGGYGVKATVICPEGKDITITIFSSSTKHTEGKPFCHITITESATGYAGLEAKNTGGHIAITGTIAGITAHKKSPTGSILCPEETDSKVSLDQDMTIEGAEIQHEGGVGELISNDPANSNALTAFEGESDCPSATYTGHKASATPHEAIPSGSTSITVTPHYGTCDVSGLPATFDMNGCDYVLDLQETTGAPDTYGVKTSIVCSGGNHVQWTAFSSGTHSAESRFCTMTFTEKAGGYTGLHATDTTNGKIDITGAIEGITAHREGGGILCPKATTETAKLDIDITVEGKNKDGGTTSISLSEIPRPGKLTSDGPVTLLGTQTGEASANALVAFGGEARCPNATFTGHKLNATPHELIPGGAETITVTPHYGACTALGFPATIDMNGCDYQFGFEVTSGVDKYSIKTTVACPPDKHVTLTIFSSANNHTQNKPFCHFTITENPAGYSGLSATDTTSGKIDITGTITGISIHKVSSPENILCPTESTTSASLKQDIAVEGRNAVSEATPISLSHD